MMACTYVNVLIFFTVRETFQMWSKSFRSIVRSSKVVQLLKRSCEEIRHDVQTIKLH